MSVEECPNCGAPMRDGKCNYCQSQQLLKDSWADGKCRNCSASLRNNLIRDKDNYLVCRYCGWPVKDKPLEDIIKPTASTPPDPEPLPPNSPARTISSSSVSAEFNISSILALFIFVIFTLAMMGPLLTTISKTSANITTTNHPVDVPVYSPGLSVILLGGAFIGGILLTFVILRNRHRRELQRKRKLLEQPR